MQFESTSMILQLAQPRLHLHLQLAQCHQHLHLLQGSSVCYAP